MEMDQNIMLILVKKYEGEYLNEKRNGKGIKYYSNDNKLFEGEYLNDLK